MIFTHQWLTDSTPLYPSSLAQVEAENSYPGISNSALRMLAGLVLKRAKMELPLPNRASCVAVIRGITGTRMRKAVLRGARQSIR